jgi:hypothetical protein
MLPYCFEKINYLITPSFVEDKKEFPVWDGYAELY